MVIGYAFQEHPLWWLPEQDRRQCLKELRQGFSAHVRRPNGTSFWINPDRTTSDTPRAERLANPEE